MYTPAELLVSVLSAVSGVGGLGLAYAGYRRDHPAARPFSVMGAGAGLWGLLYALEVLTHDLAVIRALSVGVEIGGTLAIAGYLWFVVVYTGHDEWITGPRKFVVWLWVGGRVLFAVLDPVFGVYVTEVTIQTVGGLSLPVGERTTLYYLYAIGVSYLTVLAGLVVLTRFLLSDRNMYRKQTALILAAFLFTLVGNAVFQAGFSPHPGLDVTPLFYLVELGLIALALFKYELLDVEPLAPDVVLSEIEDPVLVLDDDGRLVDHNPAAAPLFVDADPRGTAVESVLPSLLDAAQSGDEYRPRAGNVRTDGGTVEVYDLNEAPIRDQFDRQRGSAIVLRDVTVQKRRERTLEGLQSVSQRFLGATERQEVVDIAVETAVDVLGYPYSGVMLYDADDNCLRVASLADPLTEAFRTADVGDGEGPPTVGPGDSDVWKVFESGEPQLGDPLEPGEDGELPVSLGGSLLFPLGEHGVLGISAGPDHEEFTDDDRRFASILATATETALDRVQKEQQLRESRELLARRNEQIEFFNGVLRHDLLNGMMVINAHVEMLADHVDEEGQEFLETVDEWTDDVTDLTEQVRTVTKTLSGEQVVNPQPVDLQATVEEKADKIRTGYDDVSVETDLDVERVLADEFLPAVVGNVLRNAVDHNDTDHPEIRVETETVDDRIRVRVVDNGPGVPDDMKGEVFQEQVTSEDSGSVGFGLHFVSVMMDRYGGDAWFEDRPDGQRGAVAVLEFRQPDRDPDRNVSLDTAGTD